MTAGRNGNIVLADYEQSLILALRLKDVPGDQIGQIVAEVQSHVADSGEDPTEAFGPARAYAAQITADRRREPWWHIAMIAVLASLAGWLLAQGIFDLLLQKTTLGLSGWMSLGLGLIIAISGGIRLQRRSTLVRDPRTGADMVPARRWVTVAMVCLPLFALASPVVLKMVGAL